MARCWSCGKVKGKRPCPARAGELICSKCCGTKRRVEIQCPEDCVYLHGADPNWQSEAQQKEEARFIARYLSLDEKTILGVLFVHHLLFSARAGFEALTNGELVEVLETAAKTIETHSKGIVYTHQATSPHLQALADWLLKILMERQQIRGAPEVTDAEALEGLTTMRRAIEEHSAEHGDTKGGYLATAERVLESTLKDAPPLELPEDLDEPPRDLIVPP